MPLFPTRIQRESRTVEAMIRLYCREHGHGKNKGQRTKDKEQKAKIEGQGSERGHRRGQTCHACQALSDYALERLRRCPFGEGKTTCVHCPVHCYRAEQREQIRQVMRFAGPRMLTHHPILTLWHLIDGRRKTPLNWTGRTPESPTSKADGRLARVGAAEIQTLPNRCP